MRNDDQVPVDGSPADNPDLAILLTDYLDPGVVPTDDPCIVPTSDPPIIFDVTARVPADNPVGDRAREAQTDLYGRREPTGAEPEPVIGRKPHDGGLTRVGPRATVTRPSDADLCPSRGWTLVGAH